MTRLLGALLALVVVTLAGCAAPEAPDPKPNLLGEYIRSTTVKNDRMSSQTGSSEDRMANFAAHFSVDQLPCQLLCAFECAQQNRRALFNTSCDLNESVTGASRAAGGPTAKIMARVILVKHDGGGLELMTFFLAGGKLIDSTGKTFGGLDEFRANNDLLESDDIILAPRNITATSGGGELVTVYGRTSTQSWQLWLIAGGVILLIGAAFVVWRRVSRVSGADSADVEDAGGRHGDVVQ